MEHVSRPDRRVRGRPVYFILLTALLLALPAGIAGCSLFSGELAGADESDTPGLETLTRKALQEKADEFQVRYRGLLDDIASYQKDPDHKRAEGQRQKLIVEANSLASGFHELADALQLKLEQPAPDGAGSAPPSEIGGIDILNRKAYEAQADELRRRYTGIVDDLKSYEKDPNYQKAEEKRQQLISEARALAAGFKQLADSLDPRRVRSGTPEDFPAELGAQTLGIDIFDKKAVLARADEFYSKYTGAVEDISSYQRNADYKRAEEQRRNMVAQADSLASSFYDLANRLLKVLGKLVPGIEEVGKLPPR